MSGRYAAKGSELSSSSASERKSAGNGTAGYHRAVAGRCERTRGLVVGDDVLAQTAGTEVGKNRATGALEDEENRSGDSEQQAHNAGRPADAG